MAPSSIAEARTFPELVRAWLATPCAARPELDELTRRARPLLAAERTRNLGRFVALALRRAARQRADDELDAAVAADDPRCPHGRSTFDVAHDYDDA